MRCMQCFLECESRYVESEWQHAIQMLRNKVTECLSVKKKEECFCSSRRNFFKTDTYQEECCDRTAEFAPKPLISQLIQGKTKPLPRHHHIQALLDNLWPTR